MHSASCYLCKQVEREPASSPSQFTNSPSPKAHKEGVLPVPGRSGELILRKATVSKCGFRISRRSGVVAHGVVTGSSTLAAEAGGSWEFEARLICTVSFIPAWAREWNPYALPPRKKKCQRSGEILKNFLVSCSHWSKIHPTLLLSFLISKVHQFNWRALSRHGFTMLL